MPIFFKNREKIDALENSYVTENKNGKAKTVEKLKTKPNALLSGRHKMTCCTDFNNGQFVCKVP